MKINSLAEALESCSLCNEKQGFRFLNDDGSEGGFLSFADLLSKVKCFAYELSKLNLKKTNSVGLVITGQHDFIVAFYSCLWLGLVPVPLAPPYQVSKLRYYVDNLKLVVETAAIKAFIVTSDVKPFLGELLASGVKHIREVGELKSGNQTIERVQTGLEDLAFLQFTSGSTSQPKGVMVTNSNILANCKCIAEDGLKLSTEDYFFSWLPFYHDMGLIGFVITPVIYKCSGTFISPLAFIKRPRLWLEGIAKYKATISFAPNFAYGLCTKRVSESEAQNLKLDHWKVAGCGAEPIQQNTVENFVKKFKPYGFNPKAFKACYGMAESTLAVAFPEIGVEYKFDKISGSDAKDLSYISCGSAFPDHHISIKDEEGESCKEREIGEIAIKGPSVTKGYINNKQATLSAIKDGWLYTGDLGYLSGNELYVCGRKKELIIIAGRNYYPTDIENLIFKVDGIRPGNAVAFSISDESSEKLIICAERKGKDKTTDKQLSDKIRDEIFNYLGLAVSEIVILDPGCLPKTSSGKLQRAKTKELFFENKLQEFKSGSKLEINFRILLVWTKSRLGYLLKGRLMKSKAAKL